MKTEIVSSMQETLFETTAKNMSDSILELTELGLDELLEDGVVKDIPIIRTVYALCKTGLNIRERNFIRQTAVFISAFNAGTLEKEKLIAHRQELENDPQKAAKEIERVVLLLDRMLEEDQSEVLGKLYRAYVWEQIPWDLFVELSEVNARMFLSDYKELSAIAQKPIKQEESVSAHRMYKIQRLISLGLLTENTYRLQTRNTLVHPDSENRIVTTPLGGTFYRVLRTKSGEK